MGHKKLLCLVLAIGMLAIPAVADSFSFTGAFTGDNDVQYFTFTLSDLSTVTINTWGYGGGTNVAGQTINPGGFDPVLELFAINAAGLPTGTMVAISDDAFPVGSGCQGGIADPCSDSFIVESLFDGDYMLAITQWDNCIQGTQCVTLEGNLANGFTGKTDPQGGIFIDSGGNQRNGQWAVDIQGVDVAQAVVAPVPEPSSLMLLGSGLAALAGRLRRRLRK